MSSLFLLNTSLLWPVNEIDYKLIVAVRAKTLLSQLVSGRSVLARLCPIPRYRCGRQLTLSVVSWPSFSNAKD